MSDHAIIDDVDEREFHDPLDLALDGAGSEVLKWLVIGHIAFIAGLALTILLRVDNGMVWATPLYGLPLLWRSRDYRLWQKIAVFVIGFTAIHYASVYAAEQFYREQQAIVPGLVGGAIGAGASLLLLMVFGLMRPGAAAIIFAVFGTVVLAAIGGMGVYLYQTTNAGDTGTLGQWLNMLKIYTPWQLVFAYVLAKVLRPDG